MLVSRGGRATGEDIGKAIYLLKGFNARKPRRSRDADGSPFIVDDDE